MKICYTPKKFSADRLTLIEFCEDICEEFAGQGYDLTLRQLYYQCVARDVIPNKQEEYKRLGDLIADARLAGLIDWTHIVDRTRNVMANSHWERPSELIQGAAQQYSIDKWSNQDHYIECWVEKQALEGVIGRICGTLDVAFFCCRGYVSSSEMWNAGQRLLAQIQNGKQVHIVHLGDHDPSGIDMSRDIKKRLNLFVGSHLDHTIMQDVHVLRVALNMPQIERLKPPPNPAKLTDSRAADYVERYGDSSWELDALSPVELNGIIERAVGMYRDESKWAEALVLETKGKNTLREIHAQFPEVVKFLRGEII